MMTSTAAKEHKCALCHCSIQKGADYIRERMTPWKGPNNECFYTYKAHPDCHEKYQEVGQDIDWLLPCSEGEWRHLVSG